MRAQSDLFRVARQGRFGDNFDWSEKVVAGVGFQVAVAVGDVMGSISGQRNNRDDAVEIRVDGNLIVFVDVVGHLEPCGGVDELGKVG